MDLDIERIVVFAIIGAVIGVVGYKTGKITKENIIQWLLYQVTIAEKELGTGTGKLKLGQVYDAFIRTYPIISKTVTFVEFSGYVDVALDRMKDMLKQNSKAQAFVEG